MRCERCGGEVRPVVALDIDGTLGDYHGHFLRFLSGYLGIPMLPVGKRLYDGAERFSDWCCDSFGIDKRTYRDIKLAYRQGAQKRSMPRFNGVIELTQALVKLGAEIWLTTSRPYLRLDNIDPDTREWLRRNRIWHDHLLYDADKYHILAERVDPARVVLVLDDLWYQCETAADVFGSNVPVLRGTRWNSAAPSGTIQRVDSLHDVINIATHRVRLWGHVPTTA